tara:strand:+ start:45 stop:560 length:516 start_codon:yes stop_codon:yes gene_type:complete
MKQPLVFQKRNRLQKDLETATLLNQSYDASEVIDEIKSHYIEAEKACQKWYLDKEIKNLALNADFGIAHLVDLEDEDGNAVRLDLTKVSLVVFGSCNDDWEYNYRKDVDGDTNNPHKTFFNRIKRFIRLAKTNAHTFKVMSDGSLEMKLQEDERMRYGMKWGKTLTICFRD